jgi:hypothetical protein
LSLFFANKKFFLADARFLQGDVDFDSGICHHQNLKTTYYVVIMSGRQFLSTAKVKLF